MHEARRERKVNELLKTFLLELEKKRKNGKVRENKERRRKKKLLCSLHFFVLDYVFFAFFLVHLSLAFFLPAKSDPLEARERQQERTIESADSRRQEEKRKRRRSSD